MSGTTDKTIYELKKAINSNPSLFMKLTNSPQGTDTDEIWADAIQELPELYDEKDFSKSEIMALANAKVSKNVVKKVVEKNKKKKKKKKGLFSKLKRSFKSIYGGNIVKDYNKPHHLRSVYHLNSPVMHDNGKVYIM